MIFKFRVNFIRLFFWGILCSICVLESCKDEPVTPPETPQGQNRSAEHLNANIKALKKLVDAHANNLTIQSCTPLNDGTGYSVVFSDGSRVSVLTKITISNNEEEINITGNSPNIGVKRDGDIYYWTLDGKWLLSGITNGDKIPVIGNQNITPVFNITEEGYWEITCGNNASILGKVQGTQFESYFKQVDISNPDHVIFLFADGSSIILPTYNSGEEPQEPITGHLRRIISPERPMWLIHIDTWNYPDPQKIIDLVPADILPYVVFNIGLSVSHDDQTGAWKIVEYGYETAKSWLRTCAENRVWAMVQPSSGAYSHFPDIDNYDEMESSLYNEFFRDYPNFLGFNYCEQFWGFTDAFTSTFPERMAHWVHLMKLTHKYGGYLVISFCGPYWAAANNPVAIFKRDANLEAISRQHPENLIISDKLTSKHGFLDMESTVLGAYLSGYAGQAGLRSDQSGWYTPNENDKFPVSAGAIPIVERAMLTGVTVLDGPELIWQQCFREASPIGASNGYTMRHWETFPQFHNINIDIFRKILDGTIRIPSRQEVIDRTKVVVIHDVNTGNDRDKYTAPETLFEGLYRMDDDGNMGENRSWFKKTGRYPAIPTVFQLNDPIANSFEHKVIKSQALSHWSDIPRKVEEFNTLFPQEYTGDLFAGLIENGWVTYNPYKTGQTASASIPFKYNTCDSMNLTYSKYSLGVIKEYDDKVTFYLTNYDNADLSLKTDVIKIYGSSSEPTYSYVDRGNHAPSNIVKNWSDNVLTLTVTHNGPLDLTVRCSGQATDRKTSYKTAAISLPELPEIYKGPLQYEAEHFDYKNITRNLKSGVDSGIGNYTGQGYINFGTSSSAAVRDEVNVLDEGIYSLQTKYRAPVATVATIDLYINGIKVTTPEFIKTENSRDVWDINTQPVSLRKGSNDIEFRANGNAPGDFYLDNIVIKKL
ncbi:MAG: glycoside hydrolase family 98 domain-containing protein [Proteiniphilum sp.]